MTDLNRGLRYSLISGAGPDIAVSTMGVGPAMILLHGIGSSGMSWLPVIAPLAEHYRLIIPDLRGHGQSGKPTRGYLLGDYADDLERVVADCGGPNPIILGHSLGGLSAMTWAKRHPDDARAIVLEDMPVSGGPERGPMLQEWAQLAALPHDLVVAHYRQQFPHWTEEERERRAEVITATHPAVFAELMSESQREVRVDYLEDLRTIRSPVLLIHGDVAVGGLVTPGQADRFASLGANFEVARIPGGSHALHRDSTEEFLEAVTAFLERV